MNGKMSNMVPFNRPLGNRNVAGDFHRPYESVPFNRAVGKSGVSGDFHRPYEDSEIFTFYCVTKKEEYIYHERTLEFESDLYRL